MSEIINAYKEGDYYRVIGYAKGRVVSVDVPASYVDGQDQHRSEQTLRQALETTAGVEEHGRK